MRVGIKITLNKRLYLRDPQETTLGKKIIEHSILLIDKIGLEAFNFKKLACQMQSTEASVYRYFTNKHMLLLYLVSWYWAWVSYLIDINTLNIDDPKIRLKKIIKTIVSASRENPAIDYVNENILHRIIIAEGSKTYHIKSVDEENKEGFFSNYEELSDKVAQAILEVNDSFPYPHALASNIFEMANNHIFFAEHLPRLTDISVQINNFEEVEEMLNYFTFTLINKETV